MKRLDDISVAQEMLAKEADNPSQIVLALMVDAEGKVAGPRQTLAFGFRPGSLETPPNPGGRSFVGLTGQLAVDARCNIGIGIEITSEQIDVVTINPLPNSGIPTAPQLAEKTTVRFVIGHPPTTPACRATKRPRPSPSFAISLGAPISAPSTIRGPEPCCRKWAR